MPLYFNQITASDAKAIHTNQSSEIYGLTEKSLPAASDVFIAEDSANSYSKKKITVSDLLISSTCYASWSKTVSQAPNSGGAWTNLTLDTLVANTNTGIFSQPTGNSAGIQVAVAGIYIAQYYFTSFTSGSAGTTFQIAFQFVLNNTTAYVAGATNTGTQSGYYTYSTSAQIVVALNAGDYIEVQGSLNATSSIVQSGNLSLYKLSGVAGSQGPQGAGAYTSVTVPFIQPASGSSVTATVGNTTWMTPGQYLYLSELPAQAFIQTNNTANVAPTSTTTFTSNNTAGNLIVVFAYWYNTSPTTVVVTDSAGNTYYQAGPSVVANASTTMGIFYAWNIVGGANTVTVNFSPFSSGGNDVVIAEYAGILNTSDPLENTASNSGLTGSALSSGSYTTLNPDLIVGVFVSNAGMSGPGASFTSRATNYAYVLYEDLIQTSAGPIAATATASGSNWWAALMAAFKPANGTSFYVVQSINSSTSASLKNAGTTGNITSGNMVLSNSSITSGGAQGPQGSTGATGSQGPSGSGSSIVIQNAGVNLTGTPDTTINLGSGLIATNQGSNIAGIALAAAVPLIDTTTQPATPSTGLALFSQNRPSAKHIMGCIDPQGRVDFLQGALYSQKKNFYIAGGNSTTVFTAVGFNSTTTGTATARNVATTSFFTTVQRIGYVSAATAGSSCGWRSASLQFFANNSIAGEGGFFLVVRFGIAATQTNMRWFVGLAGVSTALTNQNPSLNTNIVGIGQDTSDAHIYFMYNGAGTTYKLDLTASWPTPTANTQFYELRLFIAPGGSTYYGSLQNLDPAASAVTTFDTTASPSNIPTGTTLMAPQLWLNNGSTAAAVGIDISSVYLETSA